MPHLFADGETKAYAALVIRAAQDEQDEASCEMLPAPFVTCIEFGAFEQPAFLVPS